VVYYVVEAMATVVFFFGRPLRLGCSTEARLIYVYSLYYHGVSYLLPMLYLRESTASTVRE